MANYVYDHVDSEFLLGAPFVCFSTNDQIQKYRIADNIVERLLNAICEKRKTQYLCKDNRMIATWF